MNKQQTQSGSFSFCNPLGITEKRLQSVSVVINHVGRFISFQTLWDTKTLKPRLLDACAHAKST